MTNMLLLMLRLIHRITALQPFDLRGKGQTAQGRCKCTYSLPYSIDDHIRHCLITVILWEVPVVTLCNIQCHMPARGGGDGRCKDSRCCIKQSVPIETLVLYERTWIKSRRRIYSCYHPACRTAHGKASEHIASVFCTWLQHSQYKT